MSTTANLYPHALAPVGDDYLVSAPLVIKAAVELDAPPADVWEALGSDRMWSWLPILDQLRWLTPRPLTEGAVRTLRIGHLFTVEELFYRWEPEQRATFRVVSASRPLLDGLAEDFLLQPTPAGGTRLIWTMALAPRVPGARFLRFLAPLLRPGNKLALAGIKKILPRR